MTYFRYVHIVLVFYYSFTLFVNFVLLCILFAKGAFLVLSDISKDKDRVKMK